MVPIQGEWTRFANYREKLKYMRLWDLIPPRATTDRPLMVVDGYFGYPQPCELVGYKDEYWAVIEMDDGYHAIFGDYLAEMQPQAHQRLPNGLCFAEVLNDYIVLDIETTGLSNKSDEIIEFAAIRYTCGDELKRFHTLIKPSKPIPAKITKLTGIADEDVADAPAWDDVRDDILHFLGERPIIGHNLASFDAPFLSAKLGVELVNPKIDTLYMARKVYSRLPNHKLAYLKDVLHLGDNGSHRADSDVETTNALLWACLAPRRHEYDEMNAALDHSMASAPGERARK